MAGRIFKGVHPVQVAQPLVSFPFPFRLPAPWAFPRPFVPAGIAVSPVLREHGLVKEQGIRNNIVKTLIGKTITAQGAGGHIGGTIQVMCIRLAPILPESVCC